MSLAERTERAWWIMLVGNRVNLAGELMVAGCITAVALTGSTWWQFLSGAGVGLLVLTRAGYSTLRYFRRTILGYCQVQGMYLAAKNHYQLGVFEQERSTHG